MSRSEPRQAPPGQRLVDELPVRHYGRVPRIDPSAWYLTVTGEVESVDLVVDWEALAALPHVEMTGDLHCVSKLTEQDVHWAGVAVREVVALAPPASGVEHALVSGEYGYSASVRLEDLLSPRALLATHRQGELLSPERGGPVRLVIPHLYSFKGPKWIREICYTREPVEGFWEQRGYHLVGDAWRQERYAYQA